MAGEGEGSGTGGSAGTYRRVVVGVDDSAGGLAALRCAVSMARTSHSQLLAVRSWDLGLPRHGGRRRRSHHTAVLLCYNGVQQRIESDNLVRQTFQAAVGGVPDNVAVTIETPEGDPGVVLTCIAEAGGGVLVVGTEPGHIARRLVRGSVSRYCLSHANCPVIVVPAPAGLPMTAHAGGRR